MATSVPSIVFNEYGLTLPLESEIRAGIFSDIDTAVGGGLNPDSRTSQGQWADSFAAIVGSKNDEILSIYNNVNPDVADGRWQDAIARIYFLERGSSSGTVVVGRCVGLVGTVIPSGSLAQDTNGYRYALQAAVTISSSGYVDGQFQNVETGPLPCAIGAMNRIYTAVVGWESVVNLAAGSLGVDTESRVDFEARRRNSVAIGGMNTIQSVRAAVLSVDNVVDAFVTDNKTNASINYGSTNYPIPAHYILVSVAGGSSSAVANAIWSKAPPGIGFAGATTAIVSDTSYSAPYPTYTIKWLSPTAINVHVTVNIANNTSLPMDIAAQVRAAVTAAFNGSDGGSRARIAGQLYSGRFYAGIYGISPSVQIASIGLGVNAAGTNQALTFGVDQLPTISDSNIVVNLV